MVRALLTHKDIDLTTFELRRATQEDMHRPTADILEAEPPTFVEREPFPVLALRLKDTYTQAQHKYAQNYVTIYEIVTQAYKKRRFCIIL